MGIICTMKIKNFTLVTHSPSAPYTIVAAPEHTN